MWYKKPATSTTPQYANNDNNTQAPAPLERSRSKSGGRTSRRSSTTPDVPAPRQKRSSTGNAAANANNLRSNLHTSMLPAAGWEVPSPQPPQYNNHPRAAPNINNSAGVAGRDRDHLKAKNINRSRSPSPMGQRHAHAMAPNPPSNMSGEYHANQHLHAHGNPGRSPNEQDQNYPQRILNSGPPPTSIGNTGRAMTAGSAAEQQQHMNMRPSGIQHTGRAMTGDRPTDTQNNDNNQKPNRSTRVSVEDVLRNDTAPVSKQPSRPRHRGHTSKSPPRHSEPPRRQHNSPTRHPEPRRQHNHNNHALPPATTLATPPPTAPPSSSGNTKIMQTKSGFEQHMREQMAAALQKTAEAHQRLQEAHETDNHRDHQEPAAAAAAAETTEQQQINNNDQGNNDQAQAMMGHHLVENMNSNVQALEDKLQRHRLDLEEKNSQITGLDQQMEHYMDHTQQTLTRAFEKAQMNLVEQHDYISHRTDRVNDLKYQLAQLQSKLRLEQREMDELQGSLGHHEEKVTHCERELRNAADEHDTLGAIRQALEEEKDTLRRDVSNCESELKSLEVIQNLAMGNEF
jgi:hypothetical protein